MSDILVVSNRKLCVRPFYEQIERVAKLKPKALILREKDLSEAEYLIMLRKAAAICERHSVPLIAHTFITCAREEKIKGIHLPAPMLLERGAKGFEIIGASVHSAEEAATAQKAGATYITAGHIYETDCKKGVPPRGIKFLRQVCSAVTIPVYAIGGITEEKIPELKQCGASGGCMMSRMMTI